MSASVSVTFFGVRFELGEHETDDVQDRVDERVRRARAHKLDFYDGRFAVADDIRYFLLIGKKLGSSGYESPQPIEFEQERLTAIFNETRAKLLTGGWNEEPKLMVLFDPD